MSLADELLNNLTDEEIAAYTTEDAEQNHIVIGADRFITVPSELKRIAVQHDENVEVVTFDCPRYWKNLDMSKMKIYINYMLPSGKLGCYFANNVVIDELDTNIMHFDWNITSNATPEKGTLSFLVCIKKKDAGGKTKNHWNSELNREMYVSAGLECEEAIIAQYPDIITQILEQIDGEVIIANNPAVDKSLTIEGFAADSKATGRAISVERARIDALQAIPEGSTSADAALYDINIGYDGTDWQAPGAAVRGQAVQLANYIDNKTSQLSEEIVGVERRILGCDITEYKKVNCYSEGGKLVYNDTAVKSIYFKCDKHTIYSITKTLGNYFGVFFTDELPASGVTTYLSTLSKKTTNIIVDSLEHEYCIIWYWFVNDTETVENILSTISIEAIGTNEMVAVLEASVSANEAKINDLTDIVESQNFVCREYNLPILYLTGDTEGMNKDIKKTLSYQYKNKKGSCTVKWQGSSSIAYPKKNYTIVFDNDFEVKSGWGKHKKYCLKANWIDFSHSRNIVSARLWGEMVKNRVDDEPVYTITTENGEELLTELSEEITTYNNRLATKPNGGAIDGFPICVVINNVYQGIYTFNIPKDDWLFDMGSGGNECILCAEGSSSGVMFTGDVLLDGTDFSIEYITDETNIEWAKASLNKLINLCVNCDSTEKYNEIKEYVDIQSAIDYYIFICLLEAEDCVFRNYILTTFDGVKWHFSAYDLDQTFGLGDGGKMFYGISNNRATNIDKLLHNNRLMYLIYKYDYASLKQRYEELRNSIMSENNVYSKFIGFTKDISLALKNEEVKIWSGIPSSDVNNVSQILDFYRLRVIEQDKKIIE